MPTALEVKPPLNNPKKPSVWMASFVPLNNTFPKPRSGTLAPAPANLRSGSYKLREESTAPTTTSPTIILPGSSLVLSIRI